MHVKPARPSVVELHCDLTMFVHCELLVLIITLSLHGQVHAGEIIGGREVVAHSRPYMVLLELRTKDGITKHCGGFLLTEDFVMTAGHCQYNSVSCYAILGLHNYRHPKDAQNISVTKIFPHKDYRYHENDIMILKLSSKANFSRTVKPIAMADKDSPSLPTNCSVTGWGKTDKNSSYNSVTLMEVNVTLIDNDQCLRENCYCSKGDKGPAEGDSGGPLVCGDGKAYGVVSHIKPGPPEVPLYWYTKIPDSRRWIDKVLRDVS
ncbi:granzyme E-like [Solea senegalensis]|uniref:trypsin n=1 Tax=Solea senegalensis TaxID=28829 RepID=A0AAV6SC84_SOLSE|nr:granzyme G [Solea senegalensis]KAG7515043.1 granzyme E-like [Solea senegalensis]